MAKIANIAAVFFILIFLISFSYADTKLLCLNKGDKIQFSKCNSAISDRLCTSVTGCQFCVNEIASRVYCPANLNDCNSINAKCTSLTTSSGAGSSGSSSSINSTSQTSTQTSNTSLNTNTNNNQNSNTQTSSSISSTQTNINQNTGTQSSSQNVNIQTNSQTNDSSLNSQTDTSSGGFSIFGIKIGGNKNTDANNLDAQAGSLENDTGSSVKITGNAISAKENNPSPIIYVLTAFLLIESLIIVYLIRLFNKRKDNFVAI